MPIQYCNCDYSTLFISSFHTILHRVCLDFKLSVSKEQNKKIWFLFCNHTTCTQLLFALVPVFKHPRKILSVLVHLTVCCILDQSQMLSSMCKCCTCTYKSKFILWRVVTCKSLHRLLLSSVSNTEDWENDSQTFQIAILLMFAFQFW